jgi:hypothetical protein
MAVTDDFKDPVRFVEVHGTTILKSLNPPPENLPAALYHYTSGQGLLGILDSGYLNCTNLLYMNDSSEMDYGRAIVRRIAEDLSPISDGVQTFMQYLLRNVEQPDFQYYVTCFCEKPDLLSQWRAYGGQTAGYSLGFDADDLQTVLPEYSELVRIIYDPVEQERAVRALLQSCVGVAEECCAAYRAHQRLEDAMTRWAAISSNQVGRLITCLKSEVFAEEHEWRAVIIRFSFDTSGHRFRLAANGIVVPYYPWLFKKQGVKAARQVQHGPTVNSTLAVRSVGLLLETLGYRDVTIRALAIPLRG